MPNLTHIRRLLRSPRGHELSIGHSLNALTPADIEGLGHSSLTDPFALIRREGCEGWRELVRRKIGVSDHPAGELLAAA